MEFSITSDTCRVCLKNTPNSKLLTENYAAAALPEPRSYLDIYTALNEDLRFLMNTDSVVIPQRICGNCEAQLVIAYEFKRKCIRSETILQNIKNFYEAEGNVLIEGPSLEVDTSEKCAETVQESVVSESVFNEELEDCASKENVPEEITTEIVENFQSDIDTQQPMENYDISETILDTNDEVGYVIEEFMDDEPDSDSNEGEDFYQEQQEEAAPKSVQCPDCGKFVSTRYLPKHREIHKDQSVREKPHVCEECNARFTLKENLHKHKRIHSNEKRYACPYCQKHFLHWASRRYHIASHHTGEKRFTCEYCGAKFRNSSHYSIHIRRHTGVTPFPCHLCDRSFITGNGLKLHLISHSDTRNFLCEVCNKSYKTMKSLQTHRRISHDKEKNYVCPICDRAFSQNHVLKTHLLRNHPEYEHPPPGTIVNVRAVKRIAEKMKTMSAT